MKRKARNDEYRGRTHALTLLEGCAWVAVVIVGVAVAWGIPQALAQDDDEASDDSPSSEEQRQKALRGPKRGGVGDMMADDEPKNMFAGGGGGRLQIEGVTTTDNCSAQGVREVVEKRRLTIKACLNERGEEAKAPKRPWTMKLNFTIATDGSVSSTSIASSDLESAPVEKCINDTVSELEFSKPENKTCQVRLRLRVENPKVNFPTKNKRDRQSSDSNADSDTEHNRSSHSESAADNSPGNETEPTIDWKEWAPDAVNDMLQRGRPVFVAFTAEWDMRSDRVFDG